MGANKKRPRVRYSDKDAVGAVGGVLIYLSNNHAPFQHLALRALYIFLYIKEGLHQGPQVSLIRHWA